MDSKSGNKKLIWSSLIGIIIIYSVGKISLIQAFQLTPGPREAIVDLFISIFLILDFVFYQGKKQKTQNSLFELESYDKTQGKKKNRIFQTLDLLAIFPYELLIYSSILPKYFIFIGMFRLLRLSRFYRGLDEISPYNYISKPYKILSITMGALLVVHWIACGWLILYPVGQGDPVTMYNKAVYWALTTLTTIGYGDITPDSNIARIYTMIIMIAGVGVYGVVIGNFSRFLLESDRHKKATKEKLDDLSLFMQHYRVPSSIRVQVFQFYHLMLSQRISENDNKIISELPTALRHELQVYMNMKLVKQCNLFSKLPYECLKELVLNLNQVILRPGEIIAQKDMPSDQFILIGCGILLAEDEKGKVLSSHREGQNLGEESLYKEHAFNCTIRAKTYCEIYTLKREDFLEIINSRPDYRQMFTLEDEEEDMEPIEVIAA